MAGLECTEVTSGDLSCIVCSTGFSRENFGVGRLPKFCSDLCRKERQRQQNGGYSKPRDPAKRRPPTKTFERSCALCGTPFKSPSKAAKCCGRECGRIFGKRNSDATRLKNALARRVRECQQCGASFVMNKPNGAQCRGKIKSGLFCGAKCAAESKRIYASVAEAKEAERARKRARDGNAPLSPVAVCSECGVSFKPKKVFGLICGAKACRVSLASKLAATNSGRDLSPRPCPRCEQILTPVYGDHRRKFCSRKCGERYHRKKLGSHRKRAKHHGVHYEPVNVLVVFDRDGWRCQICGEKTPKRLKGKQNDRSPELDHRIPMALGGPHTYENCQCACRLCNREKGATLPVGQMNFFPVPPATSRVKHGEAWKTGISGHPGAAP